MKKRIDSGRRIPVPKDLLNQLNWKIDDVLYYECDAENGRLILTKDNKACFRCKKYPSKPRAKKKSALALSLFTVISLTQKTYRLHHKV